ncbi:hypothetical protein COF57_26220 [Bacillus wiedmannii]|uniref:Uncharacterized protein n=1 Tax=Bacillus wiedmannii TaxID=1890302 RepID=A0A2C4PWN9_9BACI|nr:hypothetical protein COF57_26220 [Bacillus wiedmannii]
MFGKTGFTSKLQKYHWVFIFTIWDQEKIVICKKRFFPFISTYLLNLNFLLTYNSFILKIKEEDDEIESKLYL